MFDDVRAFEFYYDSGNDDPKEEPSRIHERLEEIAEREGIAYERIDTADMSDDERGQLYQETVSEIRAGREYHVGNRIFTDGTFGSLRPALVIRYEDEDGVDVYPHRNDEIETVPVTVLDLLDEVEEGAEADHSDYAAIRDRTDESTPAEDQADEPAPGEGPEVGSGRKTDAASGGFVARLKNQLPL